MCCVLIQKLFLLTTASRYIGNHDYIKRTRTDIAIFVMMFLPAPGAGETTYGECY